MWCDHKMKLSRSLPKAMEYSQILANKHNKTYRIYRCEYCDCHHLTTWKEKQPYHIGEILAVIEPENND